MYVLIVYCVDQENVSVKFVVNTLTKLKCTNIFAMRISICNSTINSNISEQKSEQICVVCLNEDALSFRNSLSIIRICCLLFHKGEIHHK